MSIRQPLAVLRGHNAEITCTKFALHAAYQNLLFSGDIDGNVRIWDLETRRTTQHLYHVHDHSVMELVELVKGSSVEPPLLLSQGREGVVKQWDLHRVTQTGDPKAYSSLDNLLLRLDEGGTGRQISFCKFCLVGNGNGEERLLLACPSLVDNSTINVFDPRDDSKEPVMRMSVPGSETQYGMLMCLCSATLQHNGCRTVICSGMENGSVFVWDLAVPDEPICVMENVFQEPILSLALSTRGELIVTSTEDDVAVLRLRQDDRNPNESEVTPPIAKIASFAVPRNGIGHVAIRSTDERVFATAGWDHRVRLFDLKRHKPLGILRFHTDTVTCVDFNHFSSNEEQQQQQHVGESGTRSSTHQLHEQELLCSGSKDQRIAIWINDGMK